MLRPIVFILCLFSLAACDGQIAPSVANHPMKQTIKMDDGYKVGVVPQGNDQWVASGGKKRKENHGDTWVQYRRERAIEIASGCRVQKVLSKPDEPLLRAKVSCAAAKVDPDTKPIHYYGKDIWKK